MADSLLQLCLLRASLSHVKGDGRVASTFAVVKATPRASRVAAFVAMWAIALDDLEREELGVEEYAAWASESRATVYRRLSDFRELWPEYDTPNELAELLLEEARRSGSRPDPSMAVAV